MDLERHVQEQGGRNKGNTSHREINHQIKISPNSLKRNDHPEIAPLGDPSPKQPPSPDTLRVLFPELAVIEIMMSGNVSNVKIENSLC